uniref:Major facilitator superfamily (MFS) profile domain-containing protein n=1 Tax=Octactis speculum TaxID=3111310 RepID=A0A7S2DQZ6_9STRA|mmetsp:Transcript_52890/g.72207  ORF Transcript_52890/g.72207 Transcript_52890/m.72207 type:complete len:346 (+) Transcript_52890:2-1039(+)
MFTSLFIEEEKLVIISRLVLGLSEGLISPCIFHLLSTWFPSPELTRSLCVTLSGAEIGTAVALSLAGDFMHQPGWVAHFYVYGTIGMLWCITHWSMTSSSPEWHTQISLPEVQHITKDRPIPIGMLDNKHKTKVKWRRLFTHPTLLSIYTVHAIGTMVYNLTIAWLPTYCARQFEMTPSDMTVLAIFPCAVSMGVSIAGGWVCDYLIKRGSSRRKIRRTVTFIGFLVPAAGLQLIRLAPTFPVALAIITPSLSTVGLGPKAGYLAHILDVAPHHAGTVMGVADSISNIPCIFTTILIWRGVVDIKPFLDLTLGNSIMNAVGGLLLIFGSVCFSIGCSDEVILQKD